LTYIEPVFRKFFAEKKRDKTTQKKKSKAIPLQAWTGSEDSKNLRLSDFKTIGTSRWQVRQPYAPAAFTSQEIFLELFSVRG
jgi:hypothetical protein